VFRPRPLAEARALRDAGRREAAIAVLERFIAEGHAPPEAHWMLGRLYLAQSRPAHAAGEFRRYLELAPQGPYAAAATLRLQALKPITEPPQEAAQEPAPPSAPLTAQQQVTANRLWDQAAAAERGSRLAEALQLYRELLQAIPDYARAGEVYERMAVCAAGLPTPDHRQADHYYTLAAKEYRRVGDRENATRCRRLAAIEAEAARLETTSPKTSPAPPTQVDQQAAEQSAKQKLAQEEARARYRQAAEAWERGDLTTARMEVESARRLDPKLGEAYFLLAAIQELSGEWPAARQNYLEFLQLRPRSPQADEARRRAELLASRRLLLSADFEESGAPGVLVPTGAAADATGTAARQGAGGAAGTSHSLEVPAGNEARLHFEPLERGAVEVYFYDPGTPAERPAVTVATRQGKQVTVRAGQKTYELDAAAQQESLQRSEGWHKLTIETGERAVTAFVDGNYLGVVKPPGPLRTLTLAGPAGEGKSLRYDKIRVIAEIETEEAARSG